MIENRRVVGLEGLLERCRAIIDDPYMGAVQHWLERNPGGKVVGHFPVYFPEEIIHAGGMLPLTVAGAGNKVDTKRADSRLPGFICSICHSSLEMGLNGSLASLAACFFPAICDVSRMLAALWRLNFPNVFIKIIYFPHNLTSEGALPFLTDQYQQLRTDLEERVLGRPIGDEELRRSIGLYNENRRLLRQLYVIKRETPWLLSATELYLLMRAGTFIPKEEHNQLLGQALAVLQEREAKPRDKIRVVLEGAFCEQPPLEFLTVLEEVCYIVDDDLMLGTRWLMEDVGEEGDPLFNLAQAYISGTDYAAVQHDERPPGREERFLAKVRRARAQAVIVAPAKFCEPAFDEVPTFAKLLEREGIPFLSLEFEEKATSFEQLRLQGETFAEALLFYA